MILPRFTINTTEVKISPLVVNLMFIGIMLLIYSLIFYVIVVTVGRV